MQSETFTVSNVELAGELLEALAAMGLKTPTEVQTQAIPAILDGQDVVVTASTGSGKTLAYLIPIAQKILNDYEWLEQPKKGQRVQALVIAPTRELAAQITAVCDQLLENTELTVAALIGGEDFKVQQKVLNRFPDIVVATPGRLIEHLDARSLSLLEVSTVVLDESDQLCDLGFTEDVQAVLGYVDEALSQADEGEERQCQTLMVSATTTGRTRKLAEDILSSPTILTVNARRAQNDNIRQQMLTADDERHKLQLLLWLLDHQTYGRAFVFVNTKAQADNLCGKLRYHKQKSAVLHSDMKQSVREGTLKSFKEGRSNILVATDLAARGLDIENVDLVINFDMARKGDEYMHRIGRTGRGGSQGDSFVLVMPSEWNLMASVERYLKIKFERCVIPELKGSFNGPKKVKASGKAAGSKKKKAKPTTSAKKAGKKSSGSKKLGKKKSAAKPAKK